jgi:hypothetical protein
VTPLRSPLHIVFYQEDGEWIAHCLEFDLVGVGDTKDQAMELLFGAIATQICESLRTGNLKNLFTPADGEYFRMFAAGEDVAAGEVRVTVLPSPSPEVVIGPPEARVFRRPSEVRSHSGDLVLA